MTPPETEQDPQAGIADRILDALERRDSRSRMEEELRSKLATQQALGAISERLDRLEDHLAKSTDPDRTVDVSEVQELKKQVRRLMEDRDAVLKWTIRSLAFALVTVLGIALNYIWITYIVPGKPPS